jgi:hypothetical protein
MKEPGQPKPKSQSHDCRCIGCGDIIENKRWNRKYCTACKKIKQNNQVQRYKSKRRKLLQQGKTGANNGSLAQAIGGATLAEVAQSLGVDLQEAVELERRALIKLRTNPQLQELWCNLKEALAEGRQLPDGMGLAMTPKQRGNLLLDYQQGLAEWWQRLERLDPETAEEMKPEIVRFYEKLTAAMRMGTETPAEDGR